MPSRAELNLRANAVGFDPSTINNDSKLEQKVLWLEKRGYAEAATLPTTTLTSSGVANNNETITFGGVDFIGSARVYTLKTALTGVAAFSTLTSTGTIPNDGDLVQLGSVAYLFKTTLDTGPALVNALQGNNALYEVLIGGSAANALTNLKAAINASGTPGTTYASLKTLLAHPSVTAGTLTGTTLLVTANRAGTPSYAGGLITSSVGPSATTLSWTAAALGGGVDPVPNEILIGASAAATLANIKDAINRGSLAGGPDATYSFNTTKSRGLIAGAVTATTLVITSTDSAAGGAVATTETMANFAFTGATMAGGVSGEVATVSGNAVGTLDTVGAVSGDANVTQ